MITRVRIAIAIGSGVALALSPRANLPAPDPQPELYNVTGITAPASMVTLASVQEGRISEIVAGEGTPVRKGDLVFTLDQQVQRARTDIAKAKSQSTLNIELAGARWGRARRDLDRLTSLRGDDFASSKEYSDALAEVDINHIEFELAKFARTQAVRAHEYERRVLAELNVHAPLSGYVCEHLKHVGETVDQHEGIVTLVQLHPLEVSVDCPLALAPVVNVGDRVLVRPADTHWSPRTGSVALTSRVADGASQTFKVKITVPNADGVWMSGLKVVVGFTMADSGRTSNSGRMSNGE